MIYMIGYSNFEPSQIKQIADELNGVIFDVRLRAFSYTTAYCKSKLVELLGNRYRHIPQWGNVNYKDRSLPFRIADFYGGLEIFEHESRPVILMCTCKNFLNCHRFILVSRIGGQYTEIKSASQILQPSLF